jgi:hypothetical protein
MKCLSLLMAVCFSLLGCFAAAPAAEPEGDYTVSTDEMAQVEGVLSQVLKDDLSEDFQRWEALADFSIGSPTDDRTAVLTSIQNIYALLNNPANWSERNLRGDFEEWNLSGHDDGLRLRSTHEHVETCQHQFMASGQEWSDQKSTPHVVDSPRYAS